MSSPSSFMQCLAMLAVATTPASATTIVDLSQDLPEDAAAIASSPGAAAINDIASSDPLIRSAIVLENGTVVAKYYREDVDPNTPFNICSATKSWVSLLVGLLVDGGLLGLNETLGEIFPDATAWMDVTDETLAFRKGVIVEEMLTMSSGLISPGRDGTRGGSSLSDSLSYPNIGTTGDFSYLGMSNILSYVIKERTGLTPRRYLRDNVMKQLAILETDYRWQQNADGVELAFHGLRLTPIQMAKFGQLYLQGGRTGPLFDEQLVSQSWINDSFTPHSMDSRTGMSYGYLFWKFGPHLYCALGAFGQDICIDQSTSRVVVQTRDPDFSSNSQDIAAQFNFIITPVAVNATLSFVAPSEVATNISPSAAPPKDAFGSSNGTLSEDPDSSAYTTPSEGTNSSPSFAPSMDTNNSFLGAGRIKGRLFLLGLSILAFVIC
ncbi:hypothetical protein ACHAXR_009767 [Thalassiosira sp. AJA248-18]